jgi:predicted nucleotidyltransferase
LTKHGSHAYGLNVPTSDLDVKGIGMCDEHEEEIKLDLLITQFDPKGWEKFEKKYIHDRKSTS